MDRFIETDIETKTSNHTTLKSNMDRFIDWYAQTEPISLVSFKIQYG